MELFCRDCFDINIRYDYCFSWVYLLSGIEFFDNLSTMKEKEPSMDQNTVSQNKEKLMNQQEITLDKVKSYF